MNKIIPSVIEDNGEYYIHMEEYKTLKELAEHYKHLYNELKKQKDDVVGYIKEQIPCIHDEEILDDILRMLGEIDNE